MGSAFIFKYYSCFRIEESCCTSVKTIYSEPNQNPCNVIIRFIKFWN